MNITPELLLVIAANVGSVFLMLNKFTLKLERRFVRIEKHVGLEPPPL